MVVATSLYSQNNSEHTIATVVDRRTLAPVEPGAPGAGLLMPPVAIIPAEHVSAVVTT